jgi:hypothetical protein
MGKSNLEAGAKKFSTPLKPTLLFASGEEDPRARFSLKIPGLPLGSSLSEARED